MPNCQKCQNYFPYKVIIDGRQRVLSKRKYCLNCSPFGVHNTRKLFPQGQDNQRIVECIQCLRSFVYERDKGHTLSLCNSCMGNNRKSYIKQKCLEYLGGKCCICNYDKCIAALEFHHKDRSTKEFQISGNYRRSWEKIKQELDKCILVCSNCHKELEYGDG